MSSTAGSGRVLDALIVGCGAIAGGYDSGRATAEPRTHAGAYRAHPGFRLAACVEPDPARRTAFMAAWGIAQGFADLAAVRASGLRVDVASVCAPTPAHAAALEELLDLPVAAVFCEKPLTDSAARTRALVARYAEAGRPLAVNHFRAWDPALHDLARALGDGRWGALQHAVARYGKGIRHNGGHLVHALGLLLGPLEPVRVLRRLDDGLAEGDATLDAELRTEAGAPVYLLGTDARRFDLFEATFVCARGEIALEEGLSLIRTRPVEDNPRYPGHRHLGRGTTTVGGQGQALYRAVDNLYKSVVRGDPPACDGAAALKVQEITERLLAMAPTAPAAPA